MKILILGGDGFIGSHFVDQAVSLGHDVTVFDRFPYEVSMNLEHQRGKIRFISGEFANRDDLAKSLDGQDIVYHFICATNPAESWNDPFIEIEDNLRPSIKLFELAVSKRVKKIVFPSSGGTVYGPQYKPVDEKAVPIPLSPYGIVKLATEHFLLYFQEHSGIQMDIYRIGNPYGPRQPLKRAQGVIAVWMRDILRGLEIQVYGDQNTLRDYVYIKDVSYLMTHSLNSPASSGIYNLGSGAGTSIIRLLEIFQTVIDMPIKYRIHPKRQLDNTSIVLDSSKLVAHFPCFEFKRLEDKIFETWNYFKLPRPKLYRKLSVGKKGNLS
ncbi:MAG: NAD-dependent epimerase/dehydratase family protein [Deltaproteobacteria bacterium]|nr:NAD-dependent epimerase/dehydratase family protein [Deltaproteobacteria bacterium]